MDQPNPVPAVTKPLDVAVIEGEVVFLGPGAIAFAMTVEAARLTCERLVEALGGLA